MSGQIWLLDLPDACAAGGLDVTLYDGWETRSRSSGGYDDLLGVGYHHDASSASSDDGSSDDYGWLYAEDKPIGCMRLHRDGTLVVGAAGATNTMGKGGPLTCSKGTVPQDRGNQTLIAIEAANNGVGEPWPQVQLDAYIALVGALCWWYDLDPQRDVYSHFQYCQPSTPGRKIDPAGPTPSRPAIGGSTGAATWSTPAFRDAVDAWPPPDTPTPDVEDDDMLYLVKLDTNQNLYMVGDGISSRRVRSDELDELQNAIGKGIGPTYHDPTKAGRPVITSMGAIATGSDDFLQLLGIETDESLGQPG
jgi:N-acetylmuramoyl-L-alanine amidase